MTTWETVIDEWRLSLDHMEDALERHDWDEAAAAVWSPPAPAPAARLDATQRLELADLDRRSARVARSIGEVMATLGTDLLDSARRRGAAHAYLARRG